MKNFLIKIALIVVTISPLIGADNPSVSEASYSPLSFGFDDDSHTLRIYRDVLHDTSLCELLVYQQNDELGFDVEMHVKGKVVQEIHFRREDVRVPYVFDVIGKKETMRMVKHDARWLLQSDLCDLSSVNEDIISMASIASKEDASIKNLNMEILKENIALKEEIDELKEKIKALKTR